MNPQTVPDLKIWDFPDRKCMTIALNPDLDLGSYQIKSGVVGAQRKGNRKE